MTTGTYDNEPGIVLPCCFRDFRSGNSHARFDDPFCALRFELLYLRLDVSDEFLDPRGVGSVEIENCVRHGCRNWKRLEHGDDSDVEIINFSNQARGSECSRGCFAAIRWQDDGWVNSVALHFRDRALRLSSVDGGHD